MANTKRPLWHSPKNPWDLLWRIFLYLCPSAMIIPMAFTSMFALNLWIVTRKLDSVATLALMQHLLSNERLALTGWTLFVVSLILATVGFIMLRRYYESALEKARSPKKTDPPKRSETQTSRKRNN